MPYTENAALEEAGLHTVPIVRVVEAVPASPTKVHPTARVLLADDDEQVRGFVCATLSSEGYEVWLAADGRAALALASSQRPDLILLDIRMPGMDGREFAAAYRRLPGPRAPIVLCTGLEAVEAAEQAEALGANGFLRKPFGVDALLAAVRQYIPLD